MDIMVSKQEQAIDKQFLTNNANSIISTVDERERRSKALALDNSAGFEARTVIQIKVDNSGGGATDQILYIGSWASQAGTAELLGQAAGAQDNAVISDQYGVGVKFTQGLGLMTLKGAYIHDFQVIAQSEAIANSTGQLAEDIICREYFFNGDSVPITYPAAVTFEMSDNRKNMLKDENAFFYLDALNGMEYTIKAGFIGSILLQVKSADLTSFMTLLK
jgi:hypothetical protein